MKIKKKKKKFSKQKLKMNYLMFVLITNNQIKEIENEIIKFIEKKTENDFKNLFMEKKLN